MTLGAGLSTEHLLLVSETAGESARTLRLLIILEGRTGPDRRAVKSQRCHASGEADGRRGERKEELLQECAGFIILGWTQWRAGRTFFSPLCRHTDTRTFLTHTDIHVHTFVCGHICEFTCTCIHTCLYPQTHKSFKYMCTHIQIHAHT